MSDDWVRADNVRPHLPMTASADSATDLKHSSTSAKLSKFGKKILAKRNKSQPGDDAELDSTHFPLFRRETYSTQRQAQQQQQQQQDVQDFLSAGGTVKLAEPGDKRKLALVPPKLNTAAAKETSSVGTLGTPTAGVPDNYDNGRYDPWVPSKPRRREGLQVAFIDDRPEVIGHGGDETEEPAMVIGNQRKASIASMANDVSMPVPQRKFSTQDDLDFVPKPMRRTQTGLSDDMPSLSEQRETVLPGPPPPPIPPKYRQHPRPPPAQPPSMHLPEPSELNASQPPPTIQPPPAQQGQSFERNPSLRRMRAAEGMAFRLSGSFDPPPFAAEDSIHDSSSHLHIASPSRRHSDVSIDSAAIRPFSGTSSPHEVSPMSGTISVENAFVPSANPPPTRQQPTLPNLGQLEIAPSSDQQVPQTYQNAPHPIDTAPVPSRKPVARAVEQIPANPQRSNVQSGPEADTLHAPPNYPPVPQRADIEDPATLVGYGRYVGHLSAIFKMASGSLRSTPTALEWARTAVWWFLRARSGLEEIAKATITPASPEWDALTVALRAQQLNLAKVRWILLEVLPVCPDAKNFREVTDTESSLPRAFEQVLRSMKKRGLLLAEELHVQSGLDSSLWNGSPFDRYPAPQAVTHEEQDVIQAISKNNAFNFLPLNDSPHCFVLQRTYARCVITDQGVPRQMDPFIALITIVRNMNSYEPFMLLATQSPSLDICIGFASDPSLSLQDPSMGNRPALRMPKAEIDTESSSILLPLNPHEGQHLSLQCYLKHVDFGKIWSVVQPCRDAVTATKAQYSEDHSPVLTTLVMHVSHSSYLVSSSTREMETMWRADSGVLNVFYEALDPFAPNKRSSHTSATSRPRSATSSQSHSSNPDDEEGHKQKRSDRLKERMMQGRALFGKGFDKIQQHRQARERSRSPTDRAGSTSPLGRVRSGRLTLATSPSSRQLRSTQIALLNNSEKQQVALEPLEGQGFIGIRMRIKEDMELTVGKRSRMQEVVLGFAQEGDRRQTWDVLETFCNVGV